MPSAMYINPAQLAILQPGRGGHKIFMIAAKKHVTVFSRSRPRKTPGNPENRLAFQQAAKNTGGVPSRTARNLTIFNALKGHMPFYGTKATSKSKYAPLKGGPVVHGK